MGTRRLKQLVAGVVDTFPGESALMLVNALSACHRWPYTRRCRLPFGFLRNRRTICRRYVAVGHRRPVPRRFKGMTVERTWKSLRGDGAVGLTVEVGVRQQPVPDGVLAGLAHLLAEERRLVRRADGHLGGGDQIGFWGRGRRPAG